MREEVKIFLSGEDGGSISSLWAGLGRSLDALAAILVYCSCFGFVFSFFCFVLCCLPMLVRMGMTPGGWFGFFPVRKVGDFVPETLAPSANISAASKGSLMIFDGPLLL